MRYTGINLFGVYVGPIAPMIVAAWVLLIPLGRLADRFGSLRCVWHPELFPFAVYWIFLSTLVLLVQRVGR